MKKHFLNAKKVLGSPCYCAPCGFYWYYPTEKVTKFFTRWRKKVTCKKCKKILGIK